MKQCLLVLCLWVAGTVAAADAPVEFRASGPSKVVLDKPFSVSFSVNAKGKDFRLPEITDFDILAGPFESHSSSMSIINGERTSSVSYKYTYTLMARRTGTYSIPSASISVKGKKYTSTGLTIEVLPADAPVQDNRSSSSSDARSQGGGQGQSSSEVSAENLFIRTLVSKTKVHEQEAVLLTYRLYSTLDVVNFGVKKMPDFKGFMKNDLEIQPQLSLENYRGRNYATADLYQTILFPQRGGVAEIEPAEFEVVIRVENMNARRSIFDSFFDSFTNVSRSVTAPGAKVNVEALPASGRPMAFSGTVGTFTISSSISAQEVKANEAVTMTVTIEGNGNMRMIKTPAVKLPDSFEQYDPKVNNDFAVTPSGVAGKKTVEFLFIPRHAGEFEIPSVEFSYFDTRTNAYKTLRTPVYTLNVLKGEAADGSPAVVETYAGKEDVKQLGSDIRYIHTGAVALHYERQPRIGSLTSWLMYLVPLVLTLLVFLLLSKQARDNADVRIVKNKKANKVARRRLKAARRLLSEGKKDSFYDEVLRALWDYLADKMAIPVSSLTKDGVKTELRVRGVDDALVGRLMDILNTCEFARYAPGSGQQEMGTLFDDTVRVISELEGNIKR